MAYKYYNANTFGNTEDDCSIRAISLATNKSWDDTYKEISNHARMKGLMMDNKNFLDSYLDERFPRVCHYAMSVDEFMKEYPSGVYIVSMPGHLTCIIDGVNYDTFDTSDRKMWCSWKVSD